MREPAVPLLEPVAGVAWWTVGAAALDAGPGTVVLAAGLGVAVGMVLALRRRHGAGAPLPPGGRGRLLRTLGITAGFLVVVGPLLSLVSYGELAVPVACAVVGAALVPLSSLLDERALLAAAGLLMVLGAAGAVIALNTAGSLYSQGGVGLAAGVVLWVVGAHRTGLLGDLQARVRR